MEVRTGTQTGQDLEAVANSQVTESWLAFNGLLRDDTTHNGLNGLATPHQSLT